MNQADQELNADHPAARTCLNCGAGIVGDYCAACGQRVENHPPTIGHLLEELFETLTHADSRLWQTVRLLISKPGLLTLEFFAGRRARYIPPIRLYFILSILFFLLLAVGPPKGNDPVNADLNSLSAAESRCRDLKYGGPFGSVFEPRLRAACMRSIQDLQHGGTRLSRTFLQNLPKAMFVLLPLFAVIMLGFYWRPRRLFAEHLIFLVHNHSAAFLTLAMVTLLDYALPPSLESWLAPLFFGWLVWYCYRGLRVFYGKSRIGTLARLGVLGMLYITLATLIIVFTGIATALSI
jgi:hypothetical protein